jgi:hypothetical protein
MSGIATAVVGSAIIGGVVSSKNSKDAINAQKDQNKDNAAFIAEQAEKARSDAIPLFQGAQDSLYSGAETAMNTIGQSGQSQLDMMGRSSMAAQENLLAGRDQFQNAILGLDVDMSGIQAQNLQPTEGMEWLTNPQMPTSGMPDLAGTLGGVTDATNPIGISKGMTNSEVVAHALDQGIITRREYNNFQENINASGNGDATYYSNAGNASDLIGAIGKNNPGISTEWRSQLEKLFNGIYPKG